ncbi:MAG: galactose mutarotase [Acidobacteria bacterium]|nr:galactose mutarotase [Acidobacteriota bacterium]
MVTRFTFGTLPDGRPVPAFVLSNRAGAATPPSPASLPSPPSLSSPPSPASLSSPASPSSLQSLSSPSVTVMAWGATIVRWLVPGAHSPETPTVNVVLGYESLELYLAREPYLGCTIGRYCNRIANGRFTLDGRVFALTSNDGPHLLHGGVDGFDQRLWDADTTADGVVFRLHSPDGDGGFPGAIDLSTHFALTEDGTLRIDYRATTSATTVVNLTNHSYFNLAGQGHILDHELQLFASRYTPVDATLIPTGMLSPVQGTPLDFTGSPRRIGARIADLASFPGGGYDHNVVIDRDDPHALVTAARLVDPASGRTLWCRTTEPGLQLYTGNWLREGLPVAPPLTSRRYAGVCLETQHYPDSPNQPSFPSTVLRPGEVFRSTTEYQIT